MTTGRTIPVIALTTLLLTLISFGPACEVTIVSPALDDGSASTTDDGGSTSDGTTSDGTTADGTTSDGGNPNSPCPDQTNIYVSYVNESTARVVFVENYRDDANQSIKASILALQAAGDPDDTINDCITCPYQAGIRNIRYVEDGVTTSAIVPADLFLGSFSCGDHITFAFKDDRTVQTSVQTP